MERIDFKQWKAREVARLLALVETESRYYQEMLAALPVPLIVLSADRSIVSANRAFRQTFAVRAEDLSGKTIEQILPSERLLERIRDAHLQGISQPAFLLDVGERQFRAAIIPIRNWEEDSEVQTLLTLEDLSAIERPHAATPAAAAIAPSQPAPAPIAADLPAAVWQADAATLKFLAVSGGAERLLGYPVSHWLATPRFFAERIHPEDRAATLEFYKAAVVRGGDASAEFRAITASGGVVWCRETIRIAAPRASPRTIAGVITDISRRKQIEEQLLTSQRSGALHGLAGRLAHDLNNPLMIVTGYSEEMLHGLARDDPRRNDVEQILAAAERISVLTAQLLAFTRKQAGPKQPVDVSRLLARMEDKIAHAAGEAVAVEIESQPEAGSAVWALADPDQLEEVILALVSAAREDARERSRVTLGCRTEAIMEHVASATLEPDLYTAITIRDDGRGLDPEKRAAVFESFLAKDPEKTAGPALARAYAMVREWGGDIAFHSEPFRGSAFTVYLPHFEPGEKELRARAEKLVPIARPAEETRETILVVEDEAGIRALVRKILHRERYRVLEAGSAEAALEVAAAHSGRIDLLLTDVMLPGASGRTLAERLRALRPDLKVVYISGYTGGEAVQAVGFPAGARFLEKPFTLGALVSKVREALE